MCVIVTWDRGLLQGAVHACDLAVGPGMARLRAAMRAARWRTGIIEGRPQRAACRMLRCLRLCCPSTDVRQLGDLRPVLRSHRVERVGHRGDKGAHDVGGEPACGLRLPRGNGTRAGTVNGHQAIEAACFRMHLGYVELDVATGVRFELWLGGYVACQRRQAAAAIALAAAMPRVSRPAPA